MSLLKRATESTASDWLSVPEGLWRWSVGKPELKMDEKWGKYKVHFPLVLTEGEQKRLTAEHGEPEEGQQQSWRCYHRVNFSLGFMRAGKYETTSCVDFLAACLGKGNSNEFRKWLEKGGGPPRPDDLDDDVAEIALAQEWLGWWEGLEVYGSIRHNTSGGKTYANFTGPIAVGSLPGQTEADYIAHGRGKLKAIIAESGETREEHAHEAPRPLLVTEETANADPNWKRYHELYDQATALGMEIDVPELPIEKNTLVSMGVALKARIENFNTAHPVEAPAF